MSIQLDGQGKQLPSNFPYKGQWILEGRIFLFHPESTTQLGGPQFTTIFHDTNGKWNLGFDAMQLGWALKMNSDDVFKANTARELILESAEDVPASIGGTHAKRYIFRIGDKIAPLTVEAGGASGTA